MKRSLTTLGCLFIASLALAQKTAPAAKLNRPKLVVGIVVDQMRWDYLYRYYDRYTDGGFKRLLKDGFSCENTYINYLPSATAVGHSTIFTGSVPAIHGIAGNDWTEQLTGKAVYCVSDSTVKGVGNDSEEGRMSPRNLLASTVTDELRLATNFNSKVVGISLKDRASILPAGHNPTGAFWFDDASGRFITSTYYMNELPEWVTKFNAMNEPEKLVSNGWNTLYPLNTYTQSSPDAVSWEGLFAGETSSKFPHDVAAVYKTKHTVIRQTPFGNTLTLDMAKAAIQAYNLGGGAYTDFLTINCASTDYVGHMFGPNSVEVEDTYLRLDKDLSAFFSALDAKLGKGNYTVFLTADHGASHSAGFYQEHKMAGGIWQANDFKTKVNAMLKDRFGVENLVKSIYEYELNFDWAKIEKQKLDKTAVEDAAVAFLKKQPGILFATSMDKIDQAAIPDVIKTKIINGYYYKRTGSVIAIPEAGLFQGGKTGTSHGEWNPYDTHIPLVFMGWGVKQGTSNRIINMTDIAPTVAAMLHIQAPSGCIGSPITEVIK